MTAKALKHKTSQFFVDISISLESSYSITWARKVEVFEKMRRFLKSLGAYKRTLFLEPDSDDLMIKIKQLAKKM